MQLRRTGGQGPSAQTGSLAAGPGTFGRTREFSSPRVLALTLVAMSLLVFLLLRTNRPQSPPPTEQLRTLAPISLDNCPLVNQLLRGEIPSSDQGLPKAGKANEFGLVFWLKTPVLHATVNDRKVVLLKYNKYLPTQHDLKYSNTVSVLKQFGAHESRLFPEMFAYCNDAGDGFHYILVEYLSLHPSELPKPQAFAECTSRAKRVLELLVTLDEDMHLAFMDVKKGQWMARTVDSFVLQDVDDMVRSPWVPTQEQGDLYVDQVDTAKRIMQDLMPAGTTAGAVDRLWDERVFPQGYTIRYAMILLRYLLVDDLGFSWTRECKFASQQFHSCLQRVLDWAATPGEDWPAPKQALFALKECEQRGEFTKTAREPAPWRDQTPKSSNASYISCIRRDDPIKKTNPDYTSHVQLCRGNDTSSSVPTCCRAKSPQLPCYYRVKQTLCGDELN